MLHKFTNILKCILIYLLLITVLVECTMLSICAFTPGCSPNPRALSEAQPTRNMKRERLVENKTENPFQNYDLSKKLEVPSVKSRRKYLSFF